MIDIKNMKNNVKENIENIENIENTKNSVKEKCIKHKNCVKENIYLIIVSVIVFVVSIAPVCLYFYYMNNVFSTKNSDWGNFGSYIGGIFGGLAFIILLFNTGVDKVRFRQEEFERTFFMLLEQHNTKLNSLEHREIIDKLYDNIKKSYSFNKIKYSLNFDGYAELNAYFILLHRILKFIKNNKQYNIDNQYSSILRSFLSKKVLYLLSFHLMINYKNTQYNDYIEYINKFSFLEHIDLIEIETEFLYFTSCEAFHGEFYEKFNEQFTEEFNLGSEPKFKDVLQLLYIALNAIADNSFNFPKNDKIQDSKGIKILKSRKNKYIEIPQDKDILTHMENTVFLFIYMLTIFDDKAFNGNPYYKDIKVTYQSYIDALKAQQSSE